MQANALAVSLFAMMLGMGMSVRVSDFVRIAAYPRFVFLTAFNLLVLLPVAGVMIVFLFRLPPDLSVGLMLVATMPGGMMSNMMTDFARGDLGLSLSLTLVVTFVYLLLVPVFAPLIMFYFGGVSYEQKIPAGSFFLDLCSVTVLPVAVGVMLNTAAPLLVSEIRGVIKTAAAISVSIIFTIITIQQWNLLVTSFATIFFPVLLVFLCGFSAAIAGCWVLNADRRELTAVFMEHAVRQEGTALFIAAAVFGSTAAVLPLAVSSPIGMTFALSALAINRSFPTRIELHEI